MKATTLPRLVAVLGVAALWTLMSPAPAPAIVLDFTELANEGGITATETGGILAPIASLTVTGETISLSDREVGTIGVFSSLGSASGSRLVFNLLENDGSGAISDQVIVFVPILSGQSRVMFTSDPALFDQGTANVSTIEDGTRQFVGSYVTRL